MVAKIERKREEKMEMNEDIIIIGAGIAGLTTSLALHRLGIKSLVLESSDSLRATGFALTLWTNAWRALDVLGIGKALRQNYPQIQRIQVASSVSGLSSDSTPTKEEEEMNREVRCVRRKELLASFEKELPHDTIRYSSKVVSIEDSGYFKLVHLADGTIIKTKVLIGCDGENSVVAKWLDLKKPINSGRSAIRGFVEYPEGHEFEPRFHVFFGGGVRYGFLPCDDKCLYWFFTFDESLEHDEDMETNSLKMKQFILSKINNIPKIASNVVDMTKLETISCSALKLRSPWNLLFQKFSKNNVCVAGDAFHPMTPDIGQGGCSSIEDGIVLARCLGEVFGKKTIDEIRDEKEEFEKITKGLEKYAKARRWRSVTLVSAAYFAGFIQEGKGKLINLLREKFLSEFSVNIAWWMADFHCGELIES